MEERVDFLESEVIKYAESFAELSQHFSILHNFLIVQFGNKFRAYVEAQESEVVDYETLMQQSKVAVEENADQIEEDYAEEGYTEMQLIEIEDGQEEADDGETEVAGPAPPPQALHNTRRGGRRETPNRFTKPQQQQPPARVLHNPSQIKAVVRQTQPAVQPSARRPPPPLIRRPVGGSPAPGTAGMPRIQIQQRNPTMSRSRHGQPTVTATSIIQQVQQQQQQQQQQQRRVPPVVISNRRVVSAAPTPNRSASSSPASTSSNSANFLGNGNGKYAKYYRRVDAELIQCKICNKVLKRKGKFIQHLRTHTGEKPFACEYCGATFSRKDNMGVHMQKHHEMGETGDTSVTCELCDTTLGTRQEYSQHLQSFHGYVPNPDEEQDDDEDYGELPDVDTVMEEGDEQLEQYQEEDETEEYQQEEA